MNAHRGGLIGLLLAGLALGAALLIWWLGGPQHGGGRAARALAVPALARPPAPEETIRLGTTALAAEGPLERRSAGGGEGGLAVDPTSARWLEGRLVLPPATPSDERAELRVSSFGAGDEQRVAAWLATSGGRVPPAREAACELRPDGSFRAPVHPAATRALLRLEARYLFLEAPLELDLASTRTEVRPALGAWVTGRFEPPPGAAPGTPPPFEVRLRAWSPLGVGDLLVRRTEVDAGLGFEFRGVRTDLDQTLMADPGELPAVVALSLDLTPGQHLDRSWPLAQGVTVAGRVLDAEGAPLAGALVRADTAGLPHVVRPQRSTRTDQDGVFRIAAVSPGSVALHAEHAGHASASTAPQPLADGELLAGVVLRLPAGRSVSGTVTWPDGTPAAGARVLVTERVRPGLLSGGYDRRDHETRTDAGGSFRVAELGPGPFVVRATAAPADGAPPWKGLRAEVVAGEQVALVLAAPAAVSGRVVDDRLEPIAAFTLQVAELRGPGAGEGSYGEELHRLRDPDGVFHLAGLGAGRWRLAARAEGHVGPVSLVVQVPEEPGPFLLTLPRAGSIAGTVLDPSGAPVPGAEVDFEPLEGARPWSARAAVSDRAGRFELTSLPPGTVGLTARHPGWAPARGYLVQVPAGGRAADVRLTLVAAGRLTGEIYRDDGAPDAGREVFVFTAQGDDAQSAVADAGGRFELGGLAPGGHVVVPLREADPEAPPASAEPVEVVIAAGRTVHVVLGLPAVETVRLEGRVLRAGRGVDGAELVAYRARAGALARPAQATSAGDGEFALVLEGPGEHLIAVTASGAGRAEFPVVVPRVARHRLELELPAGRIFGRVLGPDGAPAGGARVSSGAEDGTRSFGGLGPGTFSDAEGAYELAGLGPGRHTVRAGSAELGIALRAGVELADGEALELDLQLPPTGTIVGIVRAELGEPAPGASVFVRAAGGPLLNPSSRTRTDAAGRFEFAGCAAGEYTVSARRGGEASLESEPLAVAAGQATPIELLLEPAGMLVVTVLDASGGSVPAGVLVRDAAGREVGGMESADEGSLAVGVYVPERRVGPLPPGTYTVEARHGEGAARGSVELSGAEERQLTLRLE